MRLEWLSAALESDVGPVGHPNNYQRPSVMTLMRYIFKQLPSEAFGVEEDDELASCVGCH